MRPLIIGDVINAWCSCLWLRSAKALKSAPSKTRRSFAAYFDRPPPLAYKYWGLNEKATWKIVLPKAMHDINLQASSPKSSFLVLSHFNPSFLMLSIPCEICLRKGWEPQTRWDVFCQPKF